MRTYTVATTLTLMACADFAGCAKVDDRLPPAVTTAVSIDFNKGDANSTAAHYTEDAQILAPRHPAIDGRPAITAYYQANIDRYISFGNDTKWSAVRGDMAVEQGVYTVRNIRVGENVETGKYIRIWKLNNGGWKLYRDMFSADSQVSGAVSVSPEEAAPTEKSTSR